MFKFIHTLPPPVIALLLQGIALLCTGLTAAALYYQNVTLTLMSLALLCGGIAALFSYFMGLAIWWSLIQLLFIPTLIWALSIDVSPNWFLLAFLILVAVYWSTFRTQVPLYLSSKKVWLALSHLIPAPNPHQQLRFIDLGSGLGGVLEYLSLSRPDCHYFGVESAPLPFLWSRIRLSQKNNCTVQWGSLWDCDLSQYDVVFAYLSPVPMEQLWHKAKQEMHTGSTFISSTFRVPEQLPHETVQIDDLHHSTLLIWKM